MFRLPLLDRNPEARHSEPAASLRAGCGRSSTRMMVGREPRSNRLRVLAIETALEACSAAVRDVEREDGVTSGSLPMVRGHAEALVPLIAAVMSEANVGFAELDRIAVTVGPGSFTGLRVGVAAARGIALATGKPAVGVTTLAALAGPLLRGGVGGGLPPVLKARTVRVLLPVC